MVYILFAVHNRKETTLECLASIKKQTYKGYQIVVFDDGSTDGTSEAITRLFPEVKILSGDGNFWWTGSMNAGLEYILKNASEKDYILTLNDDTIFDEHYFENLLKAVAGRQDVCLGTSYTEDNKTLELGIAINWKKYTYKAKKIKKNELRKLKLIYWDDADTLSCRGTLIPISIIRKIGLFENALPHYSADYEYFLRAKRSGFRLGVAVNAITMDNSPNINKKVKDLSMYAHLFSKKSPLNIFNHLFLINHYCPNFFYKLINYFRVIVGIPLSYLIK